MGCDFDVDAFALEDAIMGGSSTAGSSRLEGGDQLPSCKFARPNAIIGGP